MRIPEPISFPYDQDYEPPAPFLEATIRGLSEKQVYAMIDSGADATMIPKPILESVQAKYMFPRVMVGVTGHSISVDMYRIEIQIGTFVLPSIKALATDRHEVIVGSDVLQHPIVTLDGIGSLCEIS